MVKKFLICGLGSIGKRHMENLECLGVPCEQISVYRTKKGTVSFGDEVLKNHANRHPVFDDLDTALSQKPDAVIISNPTSLHVPTAIKAAQAGCHLFIEKPLSHAMDGVNELIRIVEEKSLSAMIAYQLRFHPLFLQIEEWIRVRRIGWIFSAHAEMAERVTEWHPWENYKESYACRDDLGGGVILTQSHEIDYLLTLFGKPNWLFAAAGKKSGLIINVEDTADYIMNLGFGIMATVHVDYIQNPPSRWLKIIGTKGKIYWDYFGKKVKLIPLDGKEIVISEPDGFERNTMYLEEMKHFLNCIGQNEKPLITLEQGKNVLETCLELKKSAAQLERRGWL